MKKIILCVLAAAAIVGCDKRTDEDKPRDIGGMFVTIDGTDLYQADGTEFTIKGVNLNHWMCPEGYSFELTNEPIHKIDGMFTQLFGEEFMAGFWKQFKENYISLEDFRWLKSIGVNTIRMPLSYKMFTETAYLGNTDAEEGFRHIDDVVSWCKEVGMYLILDMHTAPGGQTGEHIDDSDGYPWLYENTECQELYCDIWRKIADRYKDEPIILAYELLNEPIGKEHLRLKKYLQQVFEMAATAIREVDTDHIIVIGGALYYEDYSAITNYEFDTKLMLTCHRYGRFDIDDYIELMKRTGLPVFMGEFGHWQGADDHNWTLVRNLRNAGIGYTYWPYKKMSNWESLLGFDVPDGWEEIRKFNAMDRSTDEAVRIARESIDFGKAMKAMEDYLENCRFRNCFKMSDNVNNLQFK